MDEVCRERERVCVTAAGGFIGSTLVQKLLERRYVVHATCRHPENHAKTSHLLSLPGAKERLKLFKADLFEKGSFDAAIEGCDFLINLATSLDFSKDSEAGFVQPAIDGTLDILRACKEAKTVRRVIHTSSITVAFPLNENGEFKGCIDESCWTPVQYIRKTKPLYWMYYVAKTLAEQAALQYGADHEIEVVTVLPALVGGSSLTPTLPHSTLLILTPITGNRECYETLSSFQSLMGSIPLVHVEDLCNAQIFLMHHPSARGRYLCSSDALKIPEMADFFRKCCPQIHVSSDFEDMEEDEVKSCTPISSKKLLELGFVYNYGVEEIIEDCIQCAKQMQIAGFDCKTDVC